MKRELLFTKEGKRIPEYHVWMSMKARCFNKKSNKYKRYGGRGITICERWIGDNGFINFITDMGFRPSNSHTIDRINNDGNYEKINCKWRTSKEQCNNRSSNVFLKYKGFSKTKSQWADYFGVHHNTLSAYLKRWDMKRAYEFYKLKMHQPVDRAKKIKYNGYCHNVEEWAKIFNIGKSTLYTKLRTSTFNEIYKEYN